MLARFMLQWCFFGCVEKIKHITTQALHLLEFLEDWKRYSWKSMLNWVLRWVKYGILSSPEATTTMSKIDQKLFVHEGGLPYDDVLQGHRCWFYRPLIILEFNSANFLWRASVEKNVLQVVSFIAWGMSCFLCNERMPCFLCIKRMSCHVFFIVRNVVIFFIEKCCVFFLVMKNIMFYFLEMRNVMFSLQQGMSFFFCSERMSCFLCSEECFVFFAMKEQHVFFAMRNVALSLQWRMLLKNIYGSIGFGMTILAPHMVSC